MTLETEYAEAAPEGVRSLAIETTAGRIAIWDRPGDREGGPPLLLIHGNSASKAAFGALFASPALGRWRLVAMDLPGSGDSENARVPARDYTIPAMARTASELGSVLGLDRPVVVGWSLGGHIGIEAVGQGMAMRGLVITGTPPCGPGPEEVATTFTTSDLGAVAFSESPSPEALDAYVGQLYGTRRPIPAAFYAAARRCDGRMRRIFAEHWLTGEEGVHQRSVVAAPGLPIAVIQGDGEPFYDPAIIGTLTWGSLWRGAGQIVPGTGHAPFFEDPSTYAGLLAAFTRDVDTSMSS